MSMRLPSLYIPIPSPAARQLPRRPPSYRNRRVPAAAPWMPRTRSRGEVLHFNHSPSCIALTDADADTHSDGDSSGYRLVIAGHPRLSPLPPPAGWTNFYVVETRTVTADGSPPRHLATAATAHRGPAPQPGAVSRVMGGWEALLAQFHRNYGINNGQ